MVNEGPQRVQFQDIIRLLGSHTTVAVSGGTFRAFFQPGGHCVARHAKGPAQPAQAAAFCIGAQNSVPLGPE